MTYQFKDGRLQKYAGFPVMEDNEEFDDYLKRIECQNLGGYSIEDTTLGIECTKFNGDEDRWIATLSISEQCFLVYLDSFIDYIEFIKYCSTMITANTLTMMQEEYSNLIGKLEDYDIIPEYRKKRPLAKK